MSSIETETRSVVIEREMKHPPEKVWRALTQGPLLEAWLMANDFEPVVGHKFNFRMTPVPGWNGVIDCEVLEVEPNRRLAYRWASMGVGTIVTWTLERTVSGTVVRMEQAGFGPDQDNNFRGAQYGWQQFFAKLENVLDRVML